MARVWAILAMLAGLLLAAAALPADEPNPGGGGTAPPSGQAKPEPQGEPDKDKDKDKPGPGAAENDQGVGGAETEKPGPPPPPTDTPAEPESIAPPASAPERKKAFIRSLEPNSVVKTGHDHSVSARGNLQMVIPDDEVILYCTAVDYSGETSGVATLTGDLRIETGKIVEQDGVSRIPKPENTLTGDIAYVFTKEKRAVVDKNVVIVHVPPEPPPPNADQVQEARHQTTTVYCDRLTYWYRRGDRKAVAQPKLPNTRIRFEQRNRRGTAGKATFYDFEPGQSETGDVLDMLGGVQAEDDEGQVIEAEVCRLFIDQETSQWYNVRRVVVNIEEQRNPEEPGPPPERPGEPGPGAGGQGGETKPGEGGGGTPPG